MSSNHPLAAFAPRKLRKRPSSSTSKVASSTPIKETSNVRDRDQHFQNETPLDFVEIQPVGELARLKDRNYSNVLDHIPRNTTSEVVTISEDIASDASTNTTLMSTNDPMTSGKRKNNYSDKSEVTKLPRLNNKDLEILNRALHYSKKAYEEALSAKEASLRIEIAIQDFIKERSHLSESSNTAFNVDKIKGTTRRKNFWYTQTMTNACNELFYINKNPSDEIMCDFIYTSLVDAHHEEIAKIEKTNSGWKKYWSDVLQSAVHSEFRVKRANYVRNIKGAICNTFGKVLIETIPGQKSSTEAITAWKNLENVKWAKENLWSKVDDDGDDNDTYMNRITNEVFKPDKRTSNNCVFVIAIVDLIFDANVHTTTLTAEMIVERMNKILKNQEVDEDTNQDIQIDNDYNEEIDQDD